MKNDKIQNEFILIICFIPSISINYQRKYIILQMNVTSLIAPCGMNCSICMAYLRDKNKCTGCREIDLKQPITRRRCRIKCCSIFQNDSAKYCFSCEKFPCNILKHLDKRYRLKYSMSMIENLLNIKKFGIRKFVKEEKLRWACPKCGGIICVHKGYCYSCGEKRDSV